MVLSLLVLSGGHLLKAFKTGQLVDAPPGNRLTRIVSNIWEPVTVLAVAMFVLSAHLDDRARVFALAVVSALLVNLITLLRLIGRPAGRALRRFDRVAQKSMAEVRTCKTGHHHRWCGHLENAD